MDDTRREFDSVPESALLCDRASHQIIGMTFGEEKQYISKAPKKQNPKQQEQQAEKQSDKSGELDPKEQD